MKKYMVYPGHGVGEITHVETREILGTKHRFIGLTIIDSGMKILVPENATETVGLRPIMSKSDAEKCQTILKSEIAVNGEAWNRRYREYMEKIKTGNPMEVATVLRSLEILKNEKDLSFGERKMLDFARTLLFRELSVV